MAEGICPDQPDSGSEGSTECPPANCQLEEQMFAPQRTTTAEGTVRERDVDELIQADVYACQKKIRRVPWGIGVARVKPSGTL
jgi:hypothetical protein